MIKKKGSERSAHTPIIALVHHHAARGVNEKKFPPLFFLHIPSPLSPSFQREVRVEGRRREEMRWEGGLIYR